MGWGKFCKNSIIYGFPGAGTAGKNPTTSFLYDPPTNPFLYPNAASADYMMKNMLGVAQWVENANSVAAT